MKQATLRDDGIINALTTVLKDNLLLEVIIDNKDIVDAEEKDG